MDALVMAGGRGSRLESDVEKPLVAIAGTPMIDRVLSALDASRVDRTFVATSPATPRTREHVDEPHVETPGDGYVDDLETALADDRIVPPVLTVAADLPLLAGDVVDQVMAAHDGGSLAVVVPVALKETLGVSVEEGFDVDGDWTPSGLNVVGEAADAGADDAIYRTWDARLAVNVNRPRDATIATRLVMRESINPDHGP